MPKREVKEAYEKNWLDYIQKACIPQTGSMKDGVSVENAYQANMLLDIPMGRSLHQKMKNRNQEIFNLGLVGILFASFVFFKGLECNGRTNKEYLIETKKTSTNKTLPVAPDTTKVDSTYGLR